jgi:hypothetical protein
MNALFCFGAVSCSVGCVARYDGCFVGRAILRCVVSGCVCGVRRCGGNQGFVGFLGVGWLRDVECFLRNDS